MDALAKAFCVGHTKGNGNVLAATLSPEEPANDPQRLYSIWNSANVSDARAVIGRKLRANQPPLGIPGDEIQGWIDLYYAYWKAVGEILAVESGGKGKVSCPPRGTLIIKMCQSDQRQASWTTVYEAWKEVVLALYRGYANQGFEAWTIPCLYVGGRYLRIFAIKADNERNSSATNDTTEMFQDDFDPESEKSQQQEDCARQLNRLFQLCLSDRYG